MAVLHSIKSVNSGKYRPECKDVIPHAVAFGSCFSLCRMKGEGMVYDSKVSQIA